MEYVWKRGKWVASDAENEIDLVATDCSGNNISSKQLHCHQASQMFGVWLAPDDNKSKIITEPKNATIE